MRRGRRLVISSISTVGNYEYGLYWYLYQDGTIEFEIKATGIVNTAGLKPGERRDYGTLVAPGVFAHNHQHIFNMRLDMAVDGETTGWWRSTPWRCRSGPTIPGNALTIRESVWLRSWQRGATSIDAARCWKIVNRRAHHPRPAHRLQAAAAEPRPRPSPDPQWSVARRAAFMPTSSG